MYCLIPIIFLNQQDACDMCMWAYNWPQRGKNKCGKEGALREERKWNRKCCGGRGGQRRVTVPFLSAHCSFLSFLISSRSSSPLLFISFSFRVISSHDSTCMAPPEPFIKSKFCLQLHSPLAHRQQVTITEWYVCTFVSFTKVSLKYYCPLSWTMSHSNRKSQPAWHPACSFTCAARLLPPVSYSLSLIRPS